MSPAVWHSPRRIVMTDNTAPTAIQAPVALRVCASIAALVAAFVLSLTFVPAMIATFVTGRVSIRAALTVFALSYGLSVAWYTHSTGQWMSHGAQHSDHTQQIADVVVANQVGLQADTLRAFADREVSPRAAKFDELSEFPWENIHKMRELGLFGMIFPPEYGGAGLDTLSYVLAVEEISRACASTGCGR